MDDEAIRVTAFGIGDVGAEISVHTPPALEPVGAGWAGRHAHAFVVVVSAGHTGCVVVRCMAAAQALGVAALIVLCAGSLPAHTRAHCGNRRERVVKMKGYTASPGSSVATISMVYQRWDTKAHLL